jgi:hypothetical protein
VPLERIAYVHVGGGVERDGIYHDTHAGTPHRQRTRNVPGLDTSSYRPKRTRAPDVGQCSLPGARRRGPDPEGRRQRHNGPEYIMMLD